MVQAAVDTYGRLDVAVANAGIIPLGDILESTVEDWDKVMSIDGRGMFLTCKYAIEAMLKTGGGSIVCLSSISGMEGQKRQSTYGPAKFVATGITKHLAIEWADQGIRVNAVAPGTINTERVQRLPEEPGGPSTSRRSRRCTRWAGSAIRPRSPTRSSSWPPTRRRSSPASSCRSTAAISRNNRHAPHCASGCALSVRHCGSPYAQMP